MLKIFSITFACLAIIVALSVGISNLVKYSTLGVDPANLVNVPFYDQALLMEYLLPFLIAGLIFMFSGKIRTGSIVMLLPGIAGLISTDGRVVGVLALASGLIGIFKKNAPPPVHW